MPARATRPLFVGQLPTQLISKINQNVCFLRQKYTYRRLLAFGEDGSQYVDSFRYINILFFNCKRNKLFYSRFPSCCVCYQQKSYSYDFELLRNEPSNDTLPIKRRVKLNETKEAAQPRENIIPQTKIKSKLTIPQSQYVYRSKVYPTQRSDPWKWKRLKNNLLNSMFMNYGK